MPLIYMTDIVVTSIFFSTKKPSSCWDSDVKNLIK